MTTFGNAKGKIRAVMMVNLSICIVNWNTRELLRKCLESIYNKTQGMNYPATSSGEVYPKRLKFEVIIVDNASKDGSVEMLKSVFPQCKIIESKVNLGFSKGNNLALENSCGEYVLFLNPDTELITNALYGMFKFLEDNSEYGAVGCKLLNVDNSIQFTCARKLLTPFRTFCFLALLDRIFPKSEIFSNTEMNYWDHTDSRDIDCLSGACIMTRKNILDHIGGFNESYFMYGDDIELCYQIKKSGWLIYYLASEEIYHFSGASSSQRNEKYFSSIMAQEAHYKFMKDNFGMLQAIEFRIFVSLGSMTRLIASTLLCPLSFVLKKHKTKVSIYSIKKYFYIFLWSIKIRPARLSD